MTPITTLLANFTGLILKHNSQAHTISYKHAGYLIDIHLDIKILGYVLPHKVNEDQLKQLLPHSSEQQPPIYSS